MAKIELSSWDVEVGPTTRFINVRGAMKFLMTVSPFLLLCCGVAAMLLVSAEQTWGMRIPPLLFASMTGGIGLVMTYGIVLTFYLASGRR